MQGKTYGKIKKIKLKTMGNEILKLLLWQPSKDYI